MPFTRPSLTNIVDRIENDIITRLPDVGTLLRRSMLKILARVTAGSIHLVYGYLNFLAEQLFSLPCHYCFPVRKAYFF